jgi:hypothetical protein
LAVRPSLTDGQMGGDYNWYDPVNSFGTDPASSFDSSYVDGNSHGWYNNWGWLGSYAPRYSGYGLGYGSGYGRRYR